MTTNAECDYFIHVLADVHSTDIGARSRIWQFCVVLKGAVFVHNFEFAVTPSLRPGCFN